MKDFGSSDDPAVQAQLDRLAQLSLPDGRFGLETVRELLARLDDPHKRLPPVFHVAGTNGKGSVCAFLRAMLEAHGKRVHVTTSPHLVRYNERIRVAGELISDERLAALLQEILEAAEGLNPSFFEVTIAAAFTEFARVPADACVVEVGLGGRFDATNVLEPDTLAACGIAALGIDHERFLLAPEDGVPQGPLARIAFEKAGIAKKGVPLVTQSYPAQAEREIDRAATARGAQLAMRGRNWNGHVTGGLNYTDRHGELSLPLPALHGAHQANNAALAVAIIRHQNAIANSAEAIAQGIRSAIWPARLQKLGNGPLTMGREVWLDGGHNPDAGEALALHFGAQKLHLVIGMIEAKNPDAILGHLSGNIASLTAVPISTHDHHKAAAFAPSAVEAESVSSALNALPDDKLPVLIAGSLYLAGDVLRLNDELPN